MDDSNNFVIFVTEKRKFFENLQYIGLVDTFRKDCRTRVRVPPGPQIDYTIWARLVLTAFKYGKRRGLSPITGKNKAFSVNFGPVAQATAPKAMMAAA